ncbi:MAG TPA: TetR/AcrR family transcriptional regulator [Cellulomonas sp.]
METGAAGRTRSLRMPRDLRRAQVLRIAQDLFTTEGFHHVSMDDIADRAQVSKPVLYRHFPSKLDLYLTVVDARGAELLSAVDAAVATHPPGEIRPHDARAVVRGVVRAYLEFVDGAGESSALLFESDVRHDLEVRTRVERATAAITLRLERVLCDIAGVAPAVAAELAPTVAAMAQAAATRRLRAPGASDAAGTGEAPDARESAALVARLVWGGIADFVLDDDPEDEPDRADRRDPGDGPLSAHGERGPADRSTADGSA